MRGYYERSRLKTARELVDEFGQGLVGRFVFTQAIGDWPGGRARVTEIAPDAGAPEIVFEVSGDSNALVQAAVAAGKLGDDRIGVFEEERVALA